MGGQSGWSRWSPTGGDSKIGGPPPRARPAAPGSPRPISTPLRKFRSPRGTGSSVPPLDHLGEVLTESLGRFPSGRIRRDIGPSVPIPPPAPLHRTGSTGEFPQLSAARELLEYPLKSRRLTPWQAPSPSPASNLAPTSAQPRGGFSHVAITHRNRPLPQPCSPARSSPMPPQPPRPGPPAPCG